MLLILSTGCLLPAFACLWQARRAVREISMRLIALFALWCPGAQSDFWLQFSGVWAGLSAGVLMSWLILLAMPDALRTAASGPTLIAGSLTGLLFYWFWMRIS